ncbi:hypothetical protein HpNP137_00420 [Helicobacter pylori]
MAEWKTDTEEVRQIVKACRDFKRSLQEERCAQFIKDLDAYVRKEILLERRKIERQLQDAIEKLRRAKKKRSSFLGFFVKCARDLFSMVSMVIPLVELGTKACDKALNYMGENIEKWKRNVELLVQALEIYSIQTKASVELVEGAWESVKKSLDFYTDKHQEFIKHLNQASEAIDNEYNIAPPESLKKRDFESPTIVYNPKKSVFDERLKDLREDFSFSLYADLKNRINASSKPDRAANSKEHGLDLMSGTHSFDESFLLAKKHCVKNFKKALQDFAEKIKKSPNDLNAINEAFGNLETELERATENLSQKIAPILERYENDKRQAALKNRDLGFDATDLEQIAKGFIPRGYLWHFDANVLGNVALVREELLLGVKHTKGYKLWEKFLQTQD